MRSVAEPEVHREVSSPGAVDAKPDERAYLRALGKRVRILRLGRELTQEELGAAAGISRNFVSLIEHGAHGVDVVRLLRLAAALDVPLEELVRDPRPDVR